MEFNLNDPCNFVVTETGARIWNAQYADLPVEYRYTPVVAGETIKSQLWIVMSVFGKYIHMGMQEVPFQNNRLEINLAS